MKRMSKVVMALALILVFAAPAWADLKQTFNAGVQAHKQGQFQTAINYYSQIINSGRANPRGRAMVHTLRGMAYRSLRQANQAMQDFYAAIKADQNYAPAYMQRSIGWANQGKWDYSLWDLNKAIRLNSRYAAAYFNRAIVLYKKGRLNLAIRDAQMAVQLDPNNQNARKVLAALQRKKSQMAQSQAPPTQQQQQQPGDAQFGGQIKLRSGGVPEGQDFQQFLK